MSEDNKNKNINTEDLFFNDSDLTSGSINNIVNDSLHKADDGELFLEYCESESFVFDDQKLKTASFDVSKGFGLLAIAGEATGYAHSSDIDIKSLNVQNGTFKGKPYRYVVLRRTLLYPQKTGELKI